MIELVDVGAANLVGLPFIPAHSEANAEDDFIYGINYASAASGILDETGRNFVSQLIMISTTVLINFGF